MCPGLSYIKLASVFLFKMFCTELQVLRTSPSTHLVHILNFSHTLCKTNNSTGRKHWFYFVQFNEKNKELFFIHTICTQKTARCLVRNHHASGVYVYISPKTITSKPSENDIFPNSSICKYISLMNLYCLYFYPLFIYFALLDSFSLYLSWFSFSITISPFFSFPFLYWSSK
jgi:hypothetical protein